MVIQASLNPDRLGGLPDPVSPPTSISVRAEGCGLQTSHRYRIAGQDLIIDQPLPLLSQFCHRGSSSALSKEIRPPVFQPWQGCTSGLVGGQIRTLTATGTDQDLELIIDGLGRFLFGVDRQIQYPAQLRPELLAEVLCGPLLPLALQQLGIYCLHGAAIFIGDKLTVLLGVSGVGKSTLSRALAQAQAPIQAHTKGQSGGTLWADDTVAVSSDDGQIGTSPGPFPQPKWRGWRTASSRPRAEIRRIVVLQPDQSPQPALNPMTPAQATLALVRHTVAGRLLSPQQMKNQLQFAAGLAAKVDCRWLNYRQVISDLPAMVQRLMAPGNPAC